MLISFSIFSYRGVKNSYPFNTNNTGTEVQLNKKNHKVIKRVSGEANATYIFRIGGLSNKHLIEQAKNVLDVFLKEDFINLLKKAIYGYKI